MNVLLLLLFFLLTLYSKSVSDENIIINDIKALIYYINKFLVYKSPAYDYNLTLSFKKVEEYHFNFDDHRF